MWQDERLLDSLCDPSVFDTPKALALAREMMKHHPDLDVRLSSEVQQMLHAASEMSPRIHRCLEILDAISDGRRIVFPLLRLMRSENDKIRSKAAAFLGKRLQNVTWARKQLAESDQRVRANVIEALWDADSREVREILWHAARDRNNRVRGNALLGLYRLGVTEAAALIRDLGKHEESLFRATGAWVMAATEDQRFVETVKSMRDDPDRGVRAAALRSLVRLKRAEEKWIGLSVEEGIAFCEDLDDSRRIGFYVPQEVAGGLKPPDVLLWEDGAVVWEYTFREIQSNPITALILFFDCTTGKGGPFDGDTLEQWAGAMNPRDRWSIIRVQTPRGVADTLSKNEVRKLENFVTPHVLPEYKGSVSPVSGRKFEDLPFIRIDHMGSVVRLLGNGGSNRHLMLVLAPASLTPVQLASLTDWARLWEITVDIVSLQDKGTERLQALARRTRGVFTTLPLSEISADRLTRFYRSVCHRGEVTYVPTDLTKPFELKIRAPCSSSARLEPDTTS